MRFAVSGRMWLKVLAGALSAKLLVILAMVFNLCSGSFVMTDSAAAAASKSSSTRTDANFDGDKACNPELLELLRVKMAKLDEREQALDKKENDLELLKQDIEDKLRQLKTLQTKLEGPVKKRRFQEEQKLQHLAGVYSSMDPVRAATLLDKLDEDTVTKLFAIMKSKKVAKILANMTPEKAARVSQRLYGKTEDE